MARRDQPAGGGSELRQYLLADAEAFREQMCRLDAQFWNELSKPVAQLASGEAFRLHGWQLPESHPGRKAFGLNADLVLTGDDELVPFESSAALT